MRSGTKNVVVNILRPIETPDPDYNNPVPSYPAWKTGIFAYAQARKARETSINDQVVAEGVMRFEFEYYDVEGILATDVVEDEAGTRYEIQAILPDISTKEYTIVDGVVRAIGTERAS